MTFNFSVSYFVPMKKIIFCSLTAACAVILLLAANGCETTSAADNPAITPSSAYIKIGNAVEFRASGGWEYEWSLRDDTMGRLDTRRGSKVVYRSMYDPGTSNAAIQILTVKSTVSGSSQSTNSAGYERSAEAYITHISAD